MKSLIVQSNSPTSTAGALFFASCLFAFSLNVFALMLAAFCGVFHPLLIATVLTGGMLFCIQRYKKFRPPIRMRIVLAALLGITLIMSIFFSPTILDGRDQGALAQAAIHLAQEHSFDYATEESQIFFPLAGAGNALNFPGFDYTAEGTLQPHFPAPYIVWLAAFYTLFGVAGFTLAHTLLLFLFLYAFALTMRIIASERAAIVAITFALTSFPLLWIYKTTLSENMALALTWSVIALLVFYMHIVTHADLATRKPLKKERFVFYAVLCTTAALALTRIEGVAMAGIVLVSMIVTAHSRAFIARIASGPIIVLVTLLGSAVAFIVMQSYPFYKNVAKALFGDAAPSSISMPETLLSAASYNLSILTLYGALPFVICGLAGGAWLVYKKKWLALLPLCVVAPVFYYLINAHISSDHPWMLRRYTFALLPALILYATFFFFLWRRTAAPTWHILSPLIPFFVWAITLYNANITLPFLTYTDHHNLTAAVAPLAREISARDLIFVDRAASGDQWALLSGILRVNYNKHAVYLFNPADIDRIDHSAFDRVLLITPLHRRDFYSDALGHDRLHYITKYTLTTDHLTRQTKNDAYALPTQKSVTTHGILYEIDMHTTDTFHQ